MLGDSNSHRTHNTTITSRNIGTGNTTVYPWNPPNIHWASPNTITNTNDNAGDSISNRSHSGSSHSDGFLPATRSTDRGAILCEFTFS